MPEISRFFGIIIAMYYNDHSPPHFHARYGAQSAAVTIETLELLEGTLPPRALGLVSEWAAKHRAELMRNWDLARIRAVLDPIEPLE